MGFHFASRAVGEGEPGRGAIAPRAAFPSPRDFADKGGRGEYAPFPLNCQTIPPALASHCPLLALQQASLFNIESKFQEITNFPACI